MASMHAIVLSILLAFAPSREHPNARRNTAIVLVVVGVVVSITGSIMFGASNDDANDGLFRRTCTVGKPCGDSCIEMSDTCHIPTGGGGWSPPGDDNVPRGVPIAGLTMMIAGVGMAASGIIVMLTSPARVPRSIGAILSYQQIAASHSGRRGHRHASSLGKHSAYPVVHRSATGSQ